MRPDEIRTGMRVRWDGPTTPRYMRGRSGTAIGPYEDPYTRRDGPRWFVDFHDGFGPNNWVPLVSELSCLAVRAPDNRLAEEA